MKNPNELGVNKWINKLMISWSEALLELSKCPGKRRRKNLTLRTGQRSERQRKTET